MATTWISAVSFEITAKSAEDGGGATLFVALCCVCEGRVGVPWPPLFVGLWGCVTVPESLFVAL